MHDDVANSDPTASNEGAGALTCSFDSCFMGSYFNWIVFVKGVKGWSMQSSIRIVRISL